MEGLWFKRRRFGFGWTPASKEGWITLVVFVAAVLAAAFVLGQTDDRGGWPVVVYLVFVAGAVLTLVRVALEHGPKPRWRWGRKDGDDPTEDY